jgi:hypothetical protein
MDVRFLPLVPEAVLPISAPATTRSRVPPGYGVQEQCLPFPAATALGMLVRSPISFGVCEDQEVPRGGHRFRSPLEANASVEGTDPRVFYVQDDPPCQFVLNAFTFAFRGEEMVPGLSFFDREDQLAFFKVHLPYVCRTSQGVDTLFLPLINRAAPFIVLSGLVETDWYASPVNLILRKPSGTRSVHVAKGDPLAQLVFIERAHRRPDVKVLTDHNRLSRELKISMGEWNHLHREDRSAYKKLVRTQHGRVDTGPRTRTRPDK